MSKETGGVLGEFVPDNLIASVYPPPSAFTIELKTPGIIARGTVMSREEDGKYEVLGSGSGPASCIIADTTEEKDTIATAYRSGHFLRNGLIVKDEYALSADDENNLRLADIFLSDGI